MPQGTIARARSVRALAAAAGSVGERVVQVSCLLVSVPVALRYLGPEGYGVWMTVNSITSLAAFADLGLGAGLVTAVAGAIGRSDHDTARRTVSNAAALLTVIGLAGLTVLLLGHSYVPWNRLVGATSSNPEIARAAKTLVALMLLGIPLGLSSRVSVATQRGYLASAFTAFASVLGLVGVLAAVRHELSLPWFVFAASGAPIIASAANWLVLSHHVIPELKPQLTDVSLGEIRQLSRIGMRFFVLQVLAVATFGLDNLLVAHLHGAEAVSVYSVATRAIGLFPIAVGMFLNPLWPAYAEAIARRDVRWARAAMRRALLLVALAVVTAVAFLASIGPALFVLWVGADAAPSRGLLLCVMCQAVGVAAAMPFATLMNGVGAMRFQIIAGLAVLVVGLPVKVLAGAAWGVSAIPATTAVVQTLFWTLPAAAYAPRLLKAIESRTH